MHPYDRTGVTACPAGAGATVDRLPGPLPPLKPGCGRIKVYAHRLFLKVLAIIIVRHLHTVHELLTVLAQPTPEMARLRNLLTEQGTFPA
jgi:hypothetical protein